MQKIRQLSLHEAQKIAAGEVVERPANVVKELLENAIDAGATVISIYIELAGQKLIRVVDNGLGMSPEDAHACFGHHATSKMSTVEDLMHLTTFGFRGEALSSIAAVSMIHMLTKEEDAQHGIFIERQANQLVHEEYRPCATGTDISIKDLFYNVPARKKFLKKTETEWRAIVQLFHAFCLDYPTLHFKLYSENKLLYNCPPPASLLARVMQLWEHHDAQHILALPSHRHEGMIISGVLSNHQYYKYDRSHMYFFVNKRWVKNSSLARAAVRGYAQVIPPDRYPIVSIHIEIDTTLVDINIHPRKEEVQFLHPRTIENALTHAIKKTLEENLSLQLHKKVSLEPRESPVASISPYTVYLSCI